MRKRIRDGKIRIWDPEQTFRIRKTAPEVDVAYG